MAFYPAGGSNVAAPLSLQSSGSNTVFGAGTTGDTFPRVELDADGGIRFGPGGGASDTRIFRSGASLLNLGAGNTLNTPFLTVSSGFLDVSTVGKGLSVAEGSNAKQGTFALSGAATTVVANTSVTANSRIILTCQALGTVTAASTLAVSARSVGTSFTVTPSQATDTSTIAFEIFEPG